jgi:hypothetical protein
MNAFPPVAGKAAIASTGVWGSALAAFIPIASLIGDALGHSSDPKLVMIGSVLAACLGLYGRITATAPIVGVISGVPPLPPGTTAG